MKEYCAKCNKICTANVKTIDEKYDVRGEEINITSEVAICNFCDEKVFNYELDVKNLNLAYSIYREKHNLLTPTDIANIRGKYSLSQRSLARLLEWGEVTINRYENGAVQDAVHNQVLMFISDPQNMKNLFEKNKHLLNQTVRDRLSKRIEKLKKDELNPRFRLTSVEDYILSRHYQNEYSGFANFNMEKMTNVILYIAEKMNGVFTTTLNKLLWYTDFLHFKENSTSISGSNYVHLPLGPVPNEYKWIISAIIEEGMLEEEEITFASGTTGTQYKALAPADQAIFSQDEVKIMNFVIDAFRDYNAKEIKEKSHTEIAYRETKNQEMISYKYASQLSINMHE